MLTEEILEAFTASGSTRPPVEVVILRSDEI